MMIVLCQKSGEVNNIEKRLMQFRVCYIIGLFFVLLTSCVREQEVPSESEEIVLASSLSNNELRSASQDLQRTEFVVGQQIGVFMTEATASPTITYGKLTYTVGAAGSLTLSAGAQPYFPSTGNKVNIYGVYPLTSANALVTPKTFSVKADQSLDANYMASDLMYGLPQAANPVTRTTQPVNLTFRHLLSKININLSSTSVLLTGAVVKIKNTLPTTTFSPQSGAISAASGVATDITVLTATATNSKGSAIIVPQTVAIGKQFIEIAVSGATYTYALPTASVFQTGKVYTYNIMVGESGLIVSTQITNWINGGSSGTAANVNILTPSANCFVVNPNSGTVVVPIKNVNIFWRRGGDGSIAKSMALAGRTGAPTAADYDYEATDSLIVDNSYVAEVIWSSAVRANTITISNKTVDNFTVSGLTTAGNVVVGVRKSTSTTYLWSWHLWVTNADLSANTVTLPSGQIAMDRNLGALSSTQGAVNTIGLVYQWGRKDPIPGSSSLTSFSATTVYRKANASKTAITSAGTNNGTLIKLVSMPDYIFTTDKNNDVVQSGYLSQGYGYNRWGGATSTTDAIPKKNIKSLYDPCPDGWRIPWGTAWAGFDYYNGTIKLIWTGNYGSTYSGNNFPTASGNYPATDGTQGSYWSGSPSGLVNGYIMRFTQWNVYNEAIVRGYYLPIRPVKQ